MSLTAARIYDWASPKCLYQWIIIALLRQAGFSIQIFPLQNQLAALDSHIFKKFHWSATYTCKTLPMLLNCLQYRRIQSYTQSNVMVSSKGWFWKTNLTVNQPIIDLRKKGQEEWLSQKWLWILSSIYSFLKGPMKEYMDF